MNQEQPGLSCHQTEIVPATCSPELELARGRRSVKPWENPLPDRRESDRRESDRPFSEQTGPSQLDQRLDIDPDLKSESQSQPSVSDRIPRRWDRLIRLVGEPAVRQLLQSHVAVFGLGGVGSFAVESLARSAIGRLTLVDFDDVCVTNVNRQLQAFPTTVGQSKSALLAQRIRAINPDAIVEPIQAFYHAENSTELLSPRPDFVIDAIDNVTAKLHLVETCLKLGIPVVSVTGSGARLDPTQVRVRDLSQTRNDPLARVLRRLLAERGFDLSQEIGLPVVYSEEPIREPIPPSWDEQGFRCICPHAADSPHACEKRRMIYGTASFVTASFGNAAVSVAIRKLIESAIDSS